MTLVIGGRTVLVPGTLGISFLDKPAVGLAVRRSQDCRLRAAGKWVRAIVLHTRMGAPVKVQKGRGKNVGWDEIFAGRMQADDRQASAHIAIDADGSYACLADLQLVQAYHASHVNELSVGIEMYQAADGSVWEATLDTCVALCDAITRAMGIQRQYVKEAAICRRLASPAAPVDRIARLACMPGGGRGTDFVGVYGHRNVTRNRGPGDPGDAIFERLASAGYEGWRIDQGGDLVTWAERQQKLGLAPSECTGVPGVSTCERIALVHARPSGLWVRRPGDEPLVG